MRRMDRASALPNRPLLLLYASALIPPCRGGVLMKANRPKGLNPTDKHVGSRIRMRRMMLRMSQTQLGEAAGVTFQQIQKYEKGVNRVSASRLQQFAKILDVTVPFFFDGAPPANVVGTMVKGDTSTPAYIDDFLVSRDGLNIMRAFQKITDGKARQCVVALVEQLANGSRRRVG